MKRRNHFKSNENSVYSNLQGNEEQTYGNLTAWDFPFYGSNSSLVAKYFSYMWLLQPITTPFIYRVEEGHHIDVVQRIFIIY